MPRSESPPVLADPADDAVSFLDRIVQWLLSSGLQIVLIVVVAAIATLLSNWLIRRVLRTMIDSSSRLSKSAAGFMVRRNPSGSKAAKAAQQRRSQRLETLSMVARNLARVLIWSIATVMILDRFGVNIAPVIASLGVVGLAAGIGAQNIIKDVISGVLMLLEDSVAVGDTVDLEYATGTVENISLRTTNVRAMDGVLWTVRNGEVIRIGNMSRGFSRAIVEVDVSVEADSEAVTGLLRTVGEELRGDPEWSEMLEGPVTASGILGVDGERIQRRLSVDVSPGQQWGVEMELRRRARMAFRQAGIDATLPRPEEAA